MANKHLLKKFKNENPDIINDLKNNNDISKKRIIRNDDFENETPTKQIKKIVKEEFSNTNSVKLDFNYEVNDVVSLKGQNDSNYGIQFFPHNFNFRKEKIENIENFFGIIVEKLSKKSGNIERTSYNVLVNGNIFTLDGVYLKTI